MRDYMVRNIVFVVAVFLLAACSTHYSSVNEGNSSGYEIIVGDEEEILEAAYQAIDRRFPDTSITTLAGHKKGYSFYVQPFLDRTTFDFVISKVEGTTIGGENVNGYIYYIKSHGTQFFVDSRYVEPLNTDFKNILMEKSISLTKAVSIKHEKE